MEISIKICSDVAGSDTRNVSNIEIIDWARIFGDINCKLKQRSKEIDDSSRQTILERNNFIMKRTRNLDLNKVEAEVQIETDGNRIKARTEQVVAKLHTVQ